MQASSSTRPSALWLDLNPDHAPAVHLRQHGPLHFTFKPTSVLQSSSLLERLFQLGWTFGTRTILPASFIFLVEYCVISYLTRDSDILALEKHRLANEKARRIAEIALEKALPIAKGEVLPAFSSADIEKVVTDVEGQITSWTPGDRFLRRHGRDGRTLAPISLQKGRSTIVKSLVTIGQGTVVAYISSQAAVCVINSSSGENVFVTENGPTSPANIIHAIQDAVYSCHKDGSIWKWDILTKLVVSLMDPDHNVVRIVRVHTETEQPVFATILVDGCTKLYRDGLIWQCIGSLADVSASQISVMALSDVFIDGNQISMLALGTQGGHVCLYDLALTRRLCLLATGPNAILQIRLVQAQPVVCPCVQEGESQSVIVIYSSGNEIGCERFFVSPDSRICTCNRAPSISSAMAPTMSSLGLKVIGSQSSSSDELSAFASSSEFLTLSRPRNRKSPSWLSSHGGSGPSQKSSHEDIAALAKEDQELLQWSSELCSVGYEPMEIGPPSSSAWELSGGLLIAGISRRTISANSQPWQTFSIDLSNQGLRDNKLRIRHTPVAFKIPVPLSPKQFVRRVDPLKNAVTGSSVCKQHQLPFWRINDIAATPARNELVATFGNSLIVIECVNYVKSPVYT